MHRTYELLRGAIVNRAYDIHKNLYIQPFFLTTFGPINYGFPNYQPELDITVRVVRAVFLYRILVPALQTT